MTTATATPDDAAFIHHEWDRRTRARDIDGLLALYLPDATLESPLVTRVMDTPTGILNGHQQLRAFFGRGTSGRPNDLVRFWRTNEFQFNGTQLMWEYPRHTPDGEQVDLVEVMELSGPAIRHHRIYWGWFGAGLLARSGT